jgi:hypothetical protein
MGDEPGYPAFGIRLGEVWVWRSDRLAAREGAHRPKTFEQLLRPDQQTFPQESQRMW